VNHVVVGATNARVDGFTIRGGNANGGFPNNRGGGVFADGTSPVIANNRIQGNTALEYGGGISCENCGA
jgi:predicted outer membrane repeat protein